MESTPAIPEPRSRTARLEGRPSDSFGDDTLYFAHWSATVPEPRAKDSRLCSDQFNWCQQAIRHSEEEKRYTNSRDFLQTMDNLTT